MRILLTNDDGLLAPGMKSLVRVAKQFGEVKVVAPDRERSACGHGMTLRDPLRVKENDAHGVPGFEVNGLPVDCVNVGLSVAWPDGCDLVLSGINNGPNMGFDVTYSGTVAGAMEGCVQGIHSVAISMAVFVDGAPYHFETGESWLCEHWQLVLGLPRHDRTFYNINIPAIEAVELNGYCFTSLGKRIYEERLESRTDPWGRTYYWQGGTVVMRSDEPDTDVFATSNGKVSITPVTLNWTDRLVLEQLRANSH